MKNTFYVIIKTALLSILLTSCGGSDSKKNKPKSGGNSATFNYLGIDKETRSFDCKLEDIRTCLNTYATYELDESIVDESEEFFERFRDLVENKNTNSEAMALIGQAKLNDLIFNINIKDEDKENKSRKVLIKKLSRLKELRLISYQIFEAMKSNAL